MAKIPSVRVGKTSADIVTAQLYLSDDPGEFNHPVIVLGMKWRTKPDYDPVTFHVGINFQRHRMGRDGRYDKPAYGLMDTRHRWSTCYAGKIELQKGGEVRMFATYSVPPDDKARIAIGEMIAETSRTFNLWHVHPECECMRVWATVQTLLGRKDVEEGVLYRVRNGLDSDPVPLWEARQSMPGTFHANERDAQSKAG